MAARSTQLHSKQVLWGFGVILQLEGHSALNFESGEISRFDPDGDCASWCIDQAMKHLNAAEQPKGIIDRNRSILKRGKLFSNLGYKWFAKLPLSSVLHVATASSVLTQQGLITYRRRVFERKVRDVSKISSSYCVFYEIGAWELYGLAETWVHTVLECTGGGRSRLLDGLLAKLENEGMPVREENWYRSRARSAAHALLLIWKLEP